MQQHIKKFSSYLIGSIAAKTEWQDGPSELRYDSGNESSCRIREEWVKQNPEIIIAVSCRLWTDMVYKTGTWSIIRKDATRRFWALYRPTLPTKSNKGFLTKFFKGMGETDPNQTIRCSVKLASARIQLITLNSQQLEMTNVMDIKFKQI